MGDLLLVLMRPLAGDLDRQPSFVVDVGHPRLGLQVGVLLDRGVILALDDDVGGAEGGVGIALANPVVAEDVAVAIGEEQRRAGGQGCFDIGHHRQIFELDDDLAQRPGRRRFVFGDDHRQLVADETDAVRVRFGRTRAAQDRLVRHDQAVLVDRHVAGREDRHDARHALRLFGVQAADDGMRPAGEEDLHRQHPGQIDVARVERLSGDLAQRIDPLQRSSDSRHTVISCTVPALAIRPAVAVEY